MKVTEILAHAVVLPLPKSATLAVVQIADVPEVLHGFSWKPKEGVYVSLINSELLDREKAECFLHEVSHVLLGHFEQLSRPTKELEQEAEQAAAVLFQLWTQGETSLEVELLEQWIEKRGQVEPLRVQ